MESKSNLPSFTVSLRGYDRVEVDEYLESMSDSLGQADEAQEENRRLEAQIARLNGRVKELEDHLNSDTPRTGAILGERIGILLRTAEETATDTVLRAEAESARIEEEAKQRLADAEEAARVSIARGQEQARRVEASARAQASEIASEAEARATARTRQIEQWAEQVISHTRAEEARMLREQEEKRRAALAELRSLGEQRDAVAATLAQLRETLGQALGLVTQPERAGSAGISGRPDTPSASASAGGTLLSVVPSDVEGPDEVPTEVSTEAPAAGSDIERAAEAAGPAPASTGTGGQDAGIDLRDDADHVEPAGASAADEDAGERDLGPGGDFPAGELDGHQPAAPVAAGTSPTVEASPTAEIAVTEIRHDDTPLSDDHDDRYGTGLQPGDESGEADEEQPWWEPRDVRPPFDGDAVDDEHEDPADEQLELRSTAGRSSADEQEFEAKLEAWVSDGAKHFRRW